VRPSEASDQTLTEIPEDIVCGIIHLGYSSGEDYEE
jgi:hypothetical protein